MSSHLFIVDFGDKSSRKGVGLLKGNENHIAEFFVSDITDGNGKTLKLGEDVPKDANTDIFLVFRFQERKDWDNFVNIVKRQDEKLREYYDKPDQEEAT